MSPHAATMRPLLASLRSVEIALPDVQKAEHFFTTTWRLEVAARTAEAVYLRAGGSDAYVLSLRHAAQARLLMLTFRAASREALDVLAERVPALGGAVLAPPAPLAEPGGGEAVVLRDLQGRVLRVVWGDEVAAPAVAADAPQRLTHVVLNSRNVAEAQAFYEQALGFVLSDRTAAMAFLRIPRRPRGDHHTIALADADNDCLNHIAFLMPSVDAVMRGGGRMKDAGFAIEWGPGRHGPGNNAFNYFVGPAGFVIEYTAEVEQVDEHYRCGGPADWQWPPGRVDRWGVSPPPTARLKQAQRSIGFDAPTRAHLEDPV